MNDLDGDRGGMGKVSPLASSMTRSSLYLPQGAMWDVRNKANGLSNVWIRRRQS